MLGELFCQLGRQTLQKIHDPKMKMAQSVMFKAAVSKKLFRHSLLHINVKLKPEFSNLIYLNIYLLTYSMEQSPS
jgi:hypothetical protein